MGARFLLAAVCLFAAGLPAARGASPRAAGGHGTRSPHTQLALPRESGVVMGHLHLIVEDIEAHRRFWAALGGAPVQNGQLQLIEFPGAFVMFQPAHPTGGTVGSVVNHIGFQVKNLKGAVASWRAAGLRIEPGSVPQQVYVTAPDDIRLEMLEDTSLDAAIRIHHIHFQVVSASDTQEWYVKTFGAKATMRGRFVAADLPGINLTFTQADVAALGTKGRALDHIGFEVSHLQEFCRKLEASGVKLDRPYTRSAASTLANAFLTDPWGTYIELTENLAPAR
jgi:catechol 2,3-dioxygenase-like lactoylglutathione lyase family enzyme